LHRPSAVRLLLVLLLLAGSVVSPGLVEKPPRVLVLALDGVPYRAAAGAFEQGAFEGWPPPRPMIAPFPSMTNLSFTAMLTPFGVEPVAGYEVRHFDADHNEMVSGILNYRKHAYAWRDYFHVSAKTKGSKIANYTRPRSTFWKMLRQAEEQLLETEQDVILAHVTASDVIGHFNGGDALTEFMVQLGDWVRELDARHQEAHGGPLWLILLSDHGNSEGKVKHTKGIRKLLRRAGFRVTSKLARPDDVVAPTFGVVNFGVLYLDPARSETAARALVVHEGVEIAAWISAPRRLTVLSPDGEAQVGWREEEGQRAFSYEPVSGDPLLLTEIRKRLQESGSLDEAGYGGERDWFESTAFHEFPDPLRRLVDSLAGTYVSSPATVIYSLDPGYAMGLRTARAGVRVMGGHLEGTHGGLDRDSTSGFYMTNAPDPPPGPAVPAARALLPLMPWTPLQPAVDR
jgi:hypothetical protein